MSFRFHGVLLLVVSFLAGTASADYLKVLPKFWKNLYPEGGYGLYCGGEFGRKDGRYNVEHIYPMSWVTKALQCGDRRYCRRHNKKFKKIEADMHNLYPARRDINKARGSMPFGVVQGTRSIEQHCSTEIDFRKRLVEPRPEVRGNIARAMLYMADRYPELTLFDKQRRVLERWHKQDPVDAAERERNVLIRKLQGNANPYIR